MPDRPHPIRRLIVLFIVVLLLTGGGMAAYVHRMRLIERDLAHGRDEGLSALQAEDYPAAMQKLGAYLKRHPDNVNALYGYAQARQKVEESGGRHLIQAIDMLRRALELDPDRHDARLNLLDLY